MSDVCPWQEHERRGKSGCAREPGLRLATFPAVAEVDELGSGQTAGLDQPLTNTAALRAGRGLLFDQRAARAGEERLDRRRGGFEHLRDLGLGQTAPVPEYKGLVLAFWKRPQGGANRGERFGLLPIRPWSKCAHPKTRSSPETHGGREPR